MDKEKKESAVRTAESFVKKSEVEKAFILGYMVRRMQLSDLETGFNYITKGKKKLLLDNEEVREDAEEKFNGKGRTVGEKSRERTNIWLSEGKSTNCKSIRCHN